MKFKNRLYLLSIIVFIFIIIYCLLQMNDITDSNDLFHSDYNDLNNDDTKRRIEMAYIERDVKDNNQNDLNNTQIIKKIEILEIPMIKNEPLIAHRLPFYNFKKNNFKVITLDKDKQDTIKNNADSKSQSNKNILGIDKSQHYLYLPDINGQFRCINSNVILKVKTF
jgi:hypothetical protein